MKKTLSQIKQERAGTLARNQAIKFRWEHTPEEERWGLLAEMGRQYNRSRERIRKIVNNPNVTLDTTYYQTHHLGYWAFYFKKLMDCLLRRQNENPKAKKQV